MAVRIFVELNVVRINDVNYGQKLFKNLVCFGIINLPEFIVQVC